MADLVVADLVVADLVVADLVVADVPPHPAVRLLLVVLSLAGLLEAALAAGPVAHLLGAVRILADLPEADLPEADLPEVVLPEVVLLAVLVVHLLAAGQNLADLLAAHPLWVRPPEHRVARPAQVVPLEAHHLSARPILLHATRLPRVDVLLHSRFQHPTHG